MPAPVTRREGALAVHSLQRFVFSVPDLAEAAKFYRAFGLDVREADGRLDLYTFGHPHRWGSIYQRAGGKRLEYVTLGAYPEDYDALVAAAARRWAFPTTRPHALADDEGVWIADPDGIAVEIVARRRCPPTARRVPRGRRAHRARRRPGAIQGAAHAAAAPVAHPACSRPT